MLDIYFTYLKKGLKSKKEKERSTAEQGIGCVAKEGCRTGSGFVTSAVPERKINTILSKTYFWTLLMLLLMGNQTE